MTIEEATTKDLIDALGGPSDIWCLEHAALLRPGWKMCWESSVAVQEQDCRFIECLLFPVPGSA